MWAAGREEGTKQGGAGQVLGRARKHSLQAQQKLARASLSVTEGGAAARLTHQQQQQVASQGALAGVVGSRVRLWVECSWIVTA
jgi:hypothetical protein